MKNITAYILGALIWYGVGTLLTSKTNILEWNIFIKIIYIIFVFLTWDKTTKELEK